MGSNIQACSLAICYLFISICLLSSHIGRWKSVKNNERTRRIETETKNGNGIAFDGSWRRWWLRIHVQEVPEEDYGLPDRLAVTEMIISGILVQKNMRKKPSQTMMTLLIDAGTQLDPFKVNGLVWSHLRKKDSVDLIQLKWKRWSREDWSKSYCCSWAVARAMCSPKLFIRWGRRMKHLGIFHVSVALGRKRIVTWESSSLKRNWKWDIWTDATEGSD